MPIQRPPRPKPGPKPPLTRAYVLTSALDIVDAEGLDALTTPRLSEHLVVDALALYRFVPGEAGLLTGVVEAVMYEVGVPTDATGWEDGFARFGESLREALVRHPNALGLMATRPPTSQGGFRPIEDALRLLTDAGVDVEDAVVAVDCLFALAVGRALAEVGPTPGPDDRDAVQEAHANAKAALPADSFPTIAAAGAGLSPDPETSFAFGVDSLVRMLQARRAPA